MTNATLFLAWQAPRSRRFYTVGRLRRNESDHFEFVYTQGFNKARAEARMEPLPNLDPAAGTYVSEELFPHFRNRILQPSREDFRLHRAQLGLATDEHDPLVVLARSGGRRETDQLSLFAEPQMVALADGRYELRMEFFTHGLRYMPEPGERAPSAGARLWLMWDFENEKDGSAMMLRTERNASVGYVPRFYSDTVRRLFQGGCSMTTTVTRANAAADAPPTYRFLCELKAEVPKDFVALEGDEFRTVVP